MIITANPSKPRRAPRGKIAAQIDLTVTPSYSGAVAGQINPGEALYLTTDAVAALYATTNSGSFCGIADDAYPLQFTDGVSGSPIPTSDANVPMVQIYEDGDHLMLQTAAETYHPYDPVYIAVGNARKITKVQSGTSVSIGYVSPDQRQSSGLVVQPIKFPITGVAGASIYIRIQPSKGK